MRLPPVESNCTHRQNAARSGARLFHVFDDMPRPAAISHEGNDRLFLSVTAVQEGAHRRSHCEYPGQGASGDGAGAFDVHTALPDVA